MMKREHKLQLAMAAGFAIHCHLENIDRLETLTSSVPYGEPRTKHTGKVLGEYSHIRRYMAAQMALGISVGELAMLTEIVGEQLDAMHPNYEKEIPLATDVALLEQVVGQEYAEAFGETISLANHMRLRDGKKPFWHDDDGDNGGGTRVIGNVIYPEAFHRAEAA